MNWTNPNEEKKLNKSFAQCGGCSNKATQQQSCFKKPYSYNQEREINKDNQINQPGTFWTDNQKAITLEKMRQRELMNKQRCCHSLSSSCNRTLNNNQSSNWERTPMNYEKHDSSINTDLKYDDLSLPRRKPLQQHIAQPKSMDQQFQNSQFYKSQQRINNPLKQESNLFKPQWTQRTPQTTDEKYDSSFWETLDSEPLIEKQTNDFYTSERLLSDFSPSNSELNSQQSTSRLNQTSFEDYKNFSDYDNPYWQGSDFGQKLQQNEQIVNNSRLNYEKEQELAKVSAKEEMKRFQQMDYLQEFQPNTSFKNPYELTQDSYNSKNSSSFTSEYQTPRLKPASETFSSNSNLRDFSLEKQQLINKKESLLEKLASVQEELGLLKKTQESHR